MGKARSQERSRWRVGAALALSTATATLGALNLKCGGAAYKSEGFAAPTMAERPTGVLINPPPVDAGAGADPPPPSAAPPPAMAERPGPPAPQPPQPAPGADADKLHRDAETLRQKGDFRGAEPLYQDALQILEKKVGGDHPEYATVLNDLGEMYREQGKFAEAERVARRALDIRDRKLGPAHPDAATSADNVAWLLWQRGDYAHAKPLAERALAARQGAFGHEHPMVAISLTTLGVLLWEQGDFAHAEPLLSHAVEIEQNALPGETQRRADVESVGQKPSGKLANRPIAVVSSADRRAAARTDLAVTLDNLGGLYWDKGDYARAEPLFQRALALEEKEHGPNHVAVAFPVSFLAKAAQERDNYDGAEKLYLRALGIWEGALGKRHPKVAVALSNLGELYLEKGEHDRAEPLFLRALEIDEQALGKEHPAVGDTVDDLAVLYREKGELAKARPLAERALAIHRRAFGDAHPAVADAYRHLSALSLAEGNIAAAIDAETRAATILDHHAAVLLAVGSEDQKRAYMAKLQKATDKTISLHAHRAPKDPRAVRLALTTILRRKGSVLDAMTESLSALRRDLNPETRDLLQRLAVVEASLGAGVLRGQGRVPPDQFKANIDSLEAERDKIEATLSTKSAALRGPLHPVTIEDVQAAIPEGAALVEITLFSPFNERASKPNERNERPRYAAYVLGRTGAPSFVDLGDAEMMDTAAEHFREALSEPTRDPRPHARVLGDRLMKPIRALLGNTRRVLLSPDGALNLLPFGALLDDDGRYMIERWSFTYLTTGRELVHAEPTPPPREKALVIADPDFGPQGAPKDAGGSTQRSVTILSKVQFFPLQATMAEGQAVEQRLADARMLTGRAATERALKAAHGPRVIHIATHGFFLPGEGESRSTRGLDNPLLRAGIALAGANPRDSDGEDGVLTALEASSLDLRGTKLVVLSACETGIGDTGRGEGVYGLRRALSIAGAETQVMSLWKVDDNATRSMMVAYYTGLRAGEGRGEALRAAQRSLLADKTTAHPYFWASFVVSGDGSPLDAAPPPPVKVPKVHPGARGCGCAEAGELGGGDPELALGLLGLAIVARRRRLNS